MINIIVSSKEEDPFVLTEYVTATELVAHYGQVLTSLPANQQTRYNNYALFANRAVSGFLYRWVDQLPLNATGAAMEYSKGIAFKYAQRLKQVDDGSANAADFKDLYIEDKEVIESVLKAQPEQVNTRRMVSNGYGPQLRPYSQAQGVEDIL